MVLTARGAEQHSTGSDTVLAWINVALALGMVGRRGAGYGCLTGQGNGQGGREHGQKADQLPGYRRIDDPAARAHVAGVWGVDPDALPGPGRSAYELLDALGTPDGPSALLVLGSNIVVSAPRATHVTSRLEALDLLVVCDVVMSETAALADVVLPVTQWAEETGTMTNLEGRVVLRQRAITPPSGVRSDLEVLAGLAERLGSTASFPTDPEEVFAELGRASAGGPADYSAITYERIRDEKGVFWGGERLFAGSFAHPDGRARMYAVEHRGAAEQPCADYPVHLTTGRVLAQYQSGAQTRRVRSLPDDGPFVEMHPLLAGRLGVGQGDPVRVATRRGEMTAPAKVVPTIRPDTVFVPFHWVGANRLTNDALDPASRMPEFKVCAASVVAHAWRPQRIVVVGGGMAAVRLSEHLAGDERFAVTVLADEASPPYNRILLSAVLEGTHSADALTLRSAEWYAGHGIDLRLGARVLEVDRDAREVVLVDGRRVAFDRLVLACGSIPTLPPIRGLVRRDGTLDPRVHAFRTLDDCRRLDAAARSSVEEGRSPVTRPRAVVVGGGLLGLQVARALAVRGLLTEVVEGADHLLASQVGSGAGAVLARDLRRLGTEVYTGARAVRLTGDGLQLDNGYVLPSDLVVLTAGGRPSTALARRAGLMVRRGVVVDHTLTSVTDDRVHAIGDCAEHRRRTTGFVPPAWEQAEVLARVLRGEEASYDGSRSVARLRATGLDVAVLGDPERAEGEVVEVTNPIAGSHRRLVVHGGRIVAAALVGDLSRVGLITQLYDRGTLLGPDEPGQLLLPEAADAPAPLPDEAEVCACAGVTAGEVRACGSVGECVDRTRATTGCGGCVDAVRRLVEDSPTPVAVG